jgi:hypothetical protein
MVSICIDASFKTKWQDREHFYSEGYLFTIALIQDFIVYRHNTLDEWSFSRVVWQLARSSLPARQSTFRSTTCSISMVCFIDRRMTSIELFLFMCISDACHRRAAFDCSTYLQPHEMQLKHINRASLSTVIMLQFVKHQSRQWVGHMLLSIFTTWSQARVAQWLEHWSSKPGVDSSILSSGINHQQNPFSLIFFASSILPGNVLDSISLASERAMLDKRISHLVCKRTISWKHGWDIKLSYV